MFHKALLITNLTNVHNFTKWKTEAQGYFSVFRCYHSFIKQQIFTENLLCTRNYSRYWGRSSKWNKRSPCPRGTYRCCSHTQMNGLVYSCQGVMNKVLNAPTILVGPPWVLSYPWHSLLCQQGMFGGEVLMALTTILPTRGVLRCTAWPAFGQKKIERFPDVFWDDGELDAVLNRSVKKRGGPSMV